MDNRAIKIKSLNSIHWWDLTQDGRFPTPRIKGKNKRIINKARRRYEKKLAYKEAGE